MNKTLLLLFLWCISNITSAQSKQDYTWLFGDDRTSALTDLGYIFDFNNGSLDIEEYNVGVGMGGNNASICDNDGNLLFYTNGCNVYNKQGLIMENGDSLNYDEFIEVFLGGDCTDLYIGSQDIMILPFPDYENKYYIIHKPFIFNGFNQPDSLPIHYSVVNMDTIDSLGTVEEKAQLVLEDDRLVSYLTAINHSNGKDWWIVQPMREDSVFTIFYIDENGIRREADQNTHVFLNSYRSSSSGTAKFSSDGTKYAFFNYYDQLHIYDFDRSSGVLSNHIKINIIDNPNVDEIWFSSIEWSPNSRFIYAASSLQLHQIDLWEENIQEDGVRLIDTFNGTLDPLPTSLYLMAQAPDCRIYICPTSSTNTYHVIKNPDELGTACNFVQNGIKLPKLSNIASMPNFPRFRVDEEEKCDLTLTSVFGNAVYYRRDLTVYPSPSDGLYTIEVPDDFRSGTLSVLNLDGQVVETKQITHGTLLVSIDITRYPSGFYHVELYPEENVDRVFWSTQVIKE